MADGREGAQLQACTCRQPRQHRRARIISEAHVILSATGCFERGCDEELWNEAPEHVRQGFVEICSRFEAPYQCCHQASQLSELINTHMQMQFGLK